MGQQSQVAAKAMGTLGDRCQRRQYLGIDLPRIGLPGDRIRPVESERLGHQPVEGIDLGIIAVKNRQEACLSSRRTLDSQHFQIHQSALDLAQVENQFVAPERGALSDGNQLRGWKWV